MKKVYAVEDFTIERVAEQVPEYSQDPLVMIEPGTEEDPTDNTIFRVKLWVYIPHQNNKKGQPLQIPILDVTNRPIQGAIADTLTQLPRGETSGQTPIGGVLDPNQVYSRMFTIFYSTLNFESDHTYDLWQIFFAYRLTKPVTSYPLIRVIKRNSDPETTRGTVTTTQDPTGGNGN